MQYIISEKECQLFEGCRIKINHEIFCMKKAPAVRQALDRVREKLSGHSGELFRKLRLLVVGVVLVKNSLRFGGIDRRDRLGVEGGRRFLIPRIDGAQKLLDARFQSGFDRFVLAGFLFGN